MCFCANAIEPAESEEHSPSLPSSYLHHVPYQEGKGVNAVCNITGDMVTYLFTISSINFWAWEWMPNGDPGARSKVVWWPCGVPPRLPCLDGQAHPSSSWGLTALSSVIVLRSSRSCPYPTPRHPASNDRSVEEFKILIPPYLKVGYSEGPPDIRGL